MAIPNNVFQKQDDFEIFLRPVNRSDMYRAYSHGIDIRNNKIITDYKYESETFYGKIWLEVFRYDEFLNEFHLGCITGYYIDLKRVYQDIKFNKGHWCFAEFDERSQLMADLWCLLRYDFKKFSSDLFYINSITIDKEYMCNEIINAIFKLIPIAFKDIYDKSINSLIYSYNQTELDDDNVKVGEENEYLGELTEEIFINNNFKKHEVTEGIFFYKDFVNNNDKLKSKKKKNKKKKK